MQTTTTKAEFWEKHIEQWRISGQSQSAYCEQHALKRHVWTYWKRKFDSEKTSLNSVGGFVPVSVEVPVSLTGLQVTLPNGIYVSGFTSVEQVSALLRVLP